MLIVIHWPHFLLLEKFQQNMDHSHESGLYIPIKFPGFDLLRDRVEEDDAKTLEKSYWVTDKTLFFKSLKSYWKSTKGNSVGEMTVF